MKGQPRFRRVSIWGSWCIAFYLLGVAFVGIVRTQQNEVERRVGMLESIRSAERLSVIESRLESIEFWGRSIFVAVVGQAVLAGMNLTRRRHP